MKNSIIVKLSFIILLVFILSCSNDDDRIEIVSSRPYFSSFYLAPELNVGIKDTTYAEFIDDTTLVILCPDLETTDKLTPSFEGMYERVYVDSVLQESGKTFHDFNNKIRYELINKDCGKACYDVIIKSGNTIPVIYISTENTLPIISKTDYLSADFIIKNCPDLGGAISAKGKIRGRGNATWKCPKKPYKIKFEEKQSPFLFASNKDWVLLAEFKDRTLMRTIVMSELSKIIGLEFAINCQYVDLYLNGIYAGLYLFTDQVEKGKNRVNIKKDGYLIERDNWYMDEPLNFATYLNFHYTFKYPDADDGEIIEGDDNYCYIRNFMNKMESSIERLKIDSLDTDYLNYIDIDSFAKWALIAQLLCVFDPNVYYYLPSRDSKIKMGPMWDVEYSFGFWSNSWGEKPEAMETIDVIMDDNKYYFNLLMKSPIFREQLKKEYTHSKEKLANVMRVIDNCAKTICYSETADYNQWEEAYRIWLNIGTNSWQEELKEMKSFFENRLRNIDNLINAN